MRSVLLAASVGEDDVEILCFDVTTPDAASGENAHAADGVNAPQSQCPQRRHRFIVADGAAAAAGDQVEVCHGVVRRKTKAVGVGQESQRGMFSGAATQGRAGGEPNGGDIAQVPRDNDGLDIGIAGRGHKVSDGRDYLVLAGADAAHWMRCLGHNENPPSGVRTWRRVEDSSRLSEVRTVEACPIPPGQIS
jgi:hypothetical protein